MRSNSVDYAHGGRQTGFDVGTTDVRAWLALWPRVLSQLDTLVVALKRRYDMKTVINNSHAYSLGWPRPAF